MSQSASTWFLAALGVALVVVVISVLVKCLCSRDTFAASDPAGYREVQERRELPGFYVEDPQLESLSPTEPYVLGGDSPAALHAGAGPLVDGGLVTIRPDNPYVHGTEPAEEEEEQPPITPFSGEEFDAW